MIVCVSMFSCLFEITDLNIQSPFAVGTQAKAASKSSSALRSAGGRQKINFTQSGQGLEGCFQCKTM